MNIYLAFLQSKINHPIPAYSFWEYYIKNGITEGGYEWQEGEVDWAEGLMYDRDQAKLARWKTETWEKTIKDLRIKHAKKPITFFLCYLSPHQVEEQAIVAIQKMGIPCVNFYCDNVRNFTKPPKQFAIFSLNWVPEYKAIGMYSKANYNFIHLPMPMWVAPEHRQIATRELGDVSFVGSRELQRWLLFEEVAKKGLKIKIYGSGWKNEGTDFGEAFMKTGLNQTLANQLESLKRFGVIGYYRKIKQRNLSINISTLLEKSLQGKPSFEEYVKITKESAITLGINRYPSYLYPLNNPNTYSRLRDIEAPMLGACYLTEWTEGLDEMYQIGEEIEVYRNIDELLYMVQSLKMDYKKRNLLRKRGQKKALEKLSIKNSLDKILSYYES